MNESENTASLFEGIQKQGGILYFKLMIVLLLLNINII